MSEDPKKDDLLQQIDARAIAKMVRRESAIASGAIVALMLLAWTYLIWLSWNVPTAISVSTASMPGVPEMRITTVRTWTLSEFLIGFAMWSVMMVGMMTPAFVPTFLAYVQLGHHPVIRNQPLAPAGWLLGGYLLAWLSFAFVATAAESTFLETGLIAPTLGSASDYFSATVLISAGLYQLSPMKDACLSRCRPPLDFIRSNGGFSLGSVASLRLGMKNGLYCVGCCWALMMVLFVVGVMELLWIAALSIFVLFGKNRP
jgi:predicted metal-binding membrane protein